MPRGVSPFMDEYTLFLCDIEIHHYIIRIATNRTTIKLIVYQ